MQFGGGSACQLSRHQTLSKRQLQLGINPLCSYCETSGFNFFKENILIPISDLSQRPPSLKTGSFLQWQLRDLL